MIYISIFDLQIDAMIYMESRQVGDQLDKGEWKIEAGAKLRLMTQSRDCGNLRKRPLETKFSEQQPRNVLFFRTF